MITVKDGGFSVGNKRKERIWLKNKDHIIAPNLYVAGTLAGWRSQFVIACGSGSLVASDIFTLWNNGVHTKVHNKNKTPINPYQAQ